MKLLDHRSGEQHDAPDGTEVIFREAKQRERRRRAAIGATILLVFGAIAAVTVVSTDGGRRAPTPITTAGSQPVPTVDVRAFAGQGALTFISRSTLWVLDGDAGALHQLPTVQGFDPESPEMSPDGRWLAYVESPATGTARNQLWIARGDGTDAHRLAVDSFAGLLGWEPGHDVLAVSLGSASSGVRRGIELITLSGAARRLVNFPAGEEVVLEGTAWSPDGSALAVSLDDLSFPDGKTVLLTYPVNGGRPTTWLSLPGRDKTLLGMKEVLVYPAGWWTPWGIAFSILYGGMTRNPDQTPLAVIANPQAAVHVIGEPAGGDKVLAAGPSGQLAIVNDPYQLLGRLASENKVLEVCDSTTVSCSAIRPSRSIVSSDPAWSPSGQMLAFTEAPASSATDLQGPAASPPAQRVLADWYAEHRLFVYTPATRSVREIPQAVGATVPMWSANGKAILYVSDDALYLLRNLVAKPIEIAGPLFPPGNWNSYFAEVDWTGQFSWAVTR